MGGSSLGRRLSRLRMQKVVRLLAVQLVQLRVVLGQRIYLRLAPPGAPAPPGLLLLLLGLRLFILLLLHGGAGQLPFRKRLGRPVSAVARLGAAALVGGGGGGGDAGAVALVGVGIAVGGRGRVVGVGLSGSALLGGFLLVLV